MLNVSRLRRFLAFAVLLAVGRFMGPALRLTDDPGIRIVLWPVLFAVAGLGCALIWCNKNAPSN